MTAVEIGREVERGLQEWCDEPLDGEEQARACDAVRALKLRTAAVSEVSECGIRFQRCGGGRRVIRKGAGGGY